MNIILKKTFRGFFFGVMGTVAIYTVCFFIELVTFIKALLGNSVDQENAVVDNVLNYTFQNYTPLIGVWNLLTVLMIAGGLCLVGTAIGFILGCAKRTDHIEKVNKNNSAVIDDGSKRQKQLFAKEIRNMAESLSTSCSENLYYMKNLVGTEYISGAADDAIMTELVKFVGYEQTIKQLMANDKEGV